MGYWIFKGAATLWLGAISVWDWAEGRVPNWLVLPPLAGVLIWRVYQSVAERSAATLLAVCLAWTIVFMLWRIHVFGGGDGKLLMVLLGFFPTWQFVLFLSASIVITGVPQIIHRRIRGGRESVNVETPNTRGALASWIPTEEKLKTEGRRNCWTFALPGAIYLWWIM